MNPFYSTLNAFGGNDGNFDNLNVWEDEQVGGNLNVDGTLTASNIVGSITTRLDNGSATDPALSFTSATSSGYYYDTSGTVSGQAWASSGAKRLKLSDTTLEVDVTLNAGTNSILSGPITATGAIQGSISSASGPTFAWGGHTNSGMYYDTNLSGPGFSRQGVEYLGLSSGGSHFYSDILMDPGTYILADSGSSTQPGLNVSNSGTGFYYDTGSSTLGLSRNAVLQTTWGPSGVNFQTNGITCDGINTGSFGISTGTIGCASLTSSGTMSCGTNAFTCGALSSVTVNSGSGTIGTLSSGTVTNTGTIKNSDGAIGAPSYTFTSDTKMGMFSQSPGFLALTTGTEVGTNPQLVINSSGAVLGGAFTNSTNSLTCGAAFPASISCSGTMSNGTSSQTTGALSCTSLTSSGTIGCGANSLTCGPLAASGQITSGTFGILCGSILASGTISNGTQSQTTGALSCSSLSVSGTTSLSNTLNCSTIFSTSSIGGRKQVITLTNNSALANANSMCLVRLNNNAAATSVSFASPGGGFIVDIIVGTSSLSNTWTINFGSSICYVKALATNLLAVTGGSGTSTIQNIIFGTTSTIGDRCTALYDGTNWFAYIVTASNTSVTFS